MAKQKGQPNRQKGYENCPGCKAVDAEHKKCNPYNATICPIAWARIENR